MEVYYFDCTLSPRAGSGAGSTAATSEQAADDRGSDCAIAGKEASNCRITRSYTSVQLTNEIGDLPASLANAASRELSPPALASAAMKRETNSAAAAAASDGGDAAVTATADESQKKKRQREGKAGGSRSSRGGGRMLITWLTGFLTIGCLQIVYYHHGVDFIHQPEQGHWFDDLDWKVPNGFDSSNASAKQQQFNVNETSATNRTSGNNSSNSTLIVSEKMNPMLAILEEAGLSTNLSANETLPSWETLTELYGPLQTPIVLGLDTCEQYRKTVSWKRRYVSVAGMFNTGTNAMDINLRKNLKMKSIWQVVSSFVHRHTTDSK